MRLATLTLAALSAVAAAQPAPPLHTTRLDNGITILYQRIPGATFTALEELHPVGLIDDPAGVPQATHLLEHLRCMSATASFPAGDAYHRLNHIGMANAETMGDVTHYDLVVPAADLSLALSVVAERMTSLQLDDQTMQAEIPRCYAEVRGVTQTFRHPGFKFALAAVSQNWNHQQPAASLLAGLNNWTLANASAACNALHDPGTLTIAIAADLDQAALDALIDQHLAPIPAPARDAMPRPPAPIDLSTLPRDATITWDSPASACFIAYPAPTDPDERLALTLWATAVHPLLTRGLPQPDAQHLMLSNIRYPVARMPLFLFAPIPPGDEGLAAADTLATSLERHAAAPDRTIASARTILAQLTDAFDAGMNLASFNQSITILADRVGPRQAQIFATGQIALDLALNHHALGPDPAARLGSLQARDQQWWSDLIRRTVTADRRVRTILAPAQPAPPSPAP